MVTLVLTVRKRGDIPASNWRTPDVPWPTLNLLIVALVSIVTVQPSPMVTLSVAAGRFPPLHVAVELQLPPAPAQETVPAGLVAQLPDRAALTPPSVTAYTCQK